MVGNVTWVCWKFTASCSSRRILQIDQELTSYSYCYGGTLIWLTVYLYFSFDSTSLQRSVGRQSTLVRLLSGWINNHQNKTFASQPRSFCARQLTFVFVNSGHRHSLRLRILACQTPGTKHSTIIQTLVCLLSADERLDVIKQVHADSFQLLISCFLAQPGRLPAYDHVLGQGQDFSSGEFFRTLVKKRWVDRPIRGNETDQPRRVPCDSPLSSR